MRSLRNLFAMALLLVPVESQAGVVIGAGAGGFEPWQGDGGVSVVGHVMGSMAEDRIRLGGEFEYREFDTTFLGVDEVDIDAYILRFVFHYIFLPDAILTPYVGAGIGIHLHTIDNERVEDESSRIVDVSEFGAGVGGQAIAGLQVPVGPLSIFGEARFGVAYQFTEKKTRAGESGHIGAENMGGITGIAGVRLSF